MNTLEAIKQLRSSLLAYCGANGRPHGRKSLREQEAQDLAAILDMKLALVEEELSGGSPPKAEQSEEDRLASLLADLALQAKAGVLGQVLGGTARTFEQTMNDVRDSGISQIEAGLGAIDQGNSLRAKGETAVEIALMRRQRELVQKKLGK